MNVYRPCGGGTAAKAYGEVAMALMEMPAEMPDVFGIPEYRCTEMRMEIAGHDIRMVFGDRRFGQVQWLYTAVVAPENLIAFCQAASSFALEVLDLRELIVHRTGH